MKKIISVFLISICLYACGGGSGGGNSNAAGNTTPSDNTTPPDEDANGIWEGALTVDGGPDYELLGLLYEGEIIALSIEANTMYKGSYTVDGDDISGNATVYEIGATAVGTATLNGVVTGKSQISFTYNTSYGATGSVSLFYDNVYERNSTLSKIAGNYSSVVSGFNTFNISIENDGSFTGSNTDGCQYSGDFTILDSNFNLYDLITTVSSCAATDGVYEGFAVLSDFNGVDDALTVTLSNENFVFISSLLRE